MFSPKLRGPLIDGVDEYASDADSLGGDRDPAERILKQIKTQTGSFVSEIACQSANDRNRYMVREPVLLQSFWKLHPFDAARQNAVISDDLSVRAYDVGARGFPLAFQGAQPQPIVQGSVAAIKGAAIMTGIQKRGRSYLAMLCWRFGYLCQSGLRFMSARSLGPAGAGASSARRKASCLSVSKMKSR